MTAIGAPHLRTAEDPAFLTGQARYIDDITIPGMVWMALVRSPHAHARVRNVDLSAALAAPGVVAAYSGLDLLGDFRRGLPCVTPFVPGIKLPPHWPLTPDKARYAGDAVAVVVAETRALAKDAAELVDVDYEPLPVILELDGALDAGAPVLHEELGDNQCYTRKWSEGEVEETFAKAAVVVRERYRQNRIIPNAMEPRGVIAQASQASGEIVLYSSTQSPHILRMCLAESLEIPVGKLRVVAPAVGGGFGSKIDVYAEEMLAIVLAKKLWRPVKWTAERSENSVATIHSREMIQEIEIAATADGRITGVRTHVTAAMGAYLQAWTPAWPAAARLVYSGCYDPVAYEIEFTGVFTNKTPTGTYRGAGRPEATYAIESVIEALARTLKLDPAEIRRRNFISKFPAKIASGITIDSGDYHVSLDRALAVAGYDELRAEQAARRARGDKRLLGIGLASYVEICGFGPSALLHSFYGAPAPGWESVSVLVNTNGEVEVRSGTTPHGQSHATTFAQIVADRLGTAVTDVHFFAGDTAIVPAGGDTYGSRSLVVGGSALHYALEKVIKKARVIAAHHLEVSEEKLEYEAGRFSVVGSPGHGMSIPEVAFEAWMAGSLPAGMEPGLMETYVYDPIGLSWPAGANIAVVEIDVETGKVDLARFIAVDDVGRVINPLIVEGQIHGGLVQGIAQALFEEAAYDDDGNLLTGSLMNYLVPSSAELPSFELDRTETPSPSNPLGAKGAAESGTIASAVAVKNAVIDALAPYGVTHIDMPVTPERVWRAIRQAGS